MQLFLDNLILTLNIKINFKIPLLLFSSTMAKV